MRPLYYIVKFYDSFPQFSIEDGPFTDSAEAFEREQEIIVKEMCDVNGTPYADAKKAVKEAQRPDLYAYGDVKFAPSSTLASVFVHGGGHSWYQVVEA